MKGSRALPTLGSERSTGTAALIVAPFAEQVVHTYIGFVSADGKSVSNGYTGMVSMAA